MPQLSAQLPTAGDAEPESSGCNDAAKHCSERSYVAPHSFGPNAGPRSPVDTDKPSGALKIAWYLHAVVPRAMGQPIRHWARYMVGSVSDRCVVTPILTPGGCATDFRARVRAPWQIP